ncbi:hypothetical protein HELRODRAFT_162770 [Helobdella robusta]|uniref:Uncharacterized protein n=1 Tax=Helobdella robusta TaxID=6412 RepID=T1ET41_HELRO|nr:hypothetical protein HELRODRAFT_162770 [Helobdella robusta]ESN99252.1 hypothetical protein HELRODRAFT_162770 [Helobdella robusta]
MHYVGGIMIGIRVLLVWMVSSMRPCWSISTSHLAKRNITLKYGPVLRGLLQQPEYDNEKLVDVEVYLGVKYATLTKNAPNDKNSDNDGNVDFTKKISKHTNKCKNKKEIGVPWQFRRSTLSSAASASPPASNASLLQRKSSPTIKLAASTTARKQAYVKSHIKFKPVCPQNTIDPKKLMAQHSLDYIARLARMQEYLSAQQLEECLNLNIYIPAKRHANDQSKIVTVEIEAVIENVLLIYSNDQKCFVLCAVSPIIKFNGRLYNVQKFNVPYNVETTVRKCQSTHLYGVLFLKSISQSRCDF